MASFPAPSALNFTTDAFPILTAAQINRIRHWGHVRNVQPGEILFEPNDSSVPFFVLLSGKLDIVQPTFDGERMLVSHGPGSFTGEMTMISGQRSLARGRVAEGGEFLELTADHVRALVAADAELSEILMRAFILRRLLLITHGYGNVILLGSRHSAQSLQLRGFFSRNGYPYTYVDLDTDATSQHMLDRFHVKVSDVPVIICNGHNVMRNPSIQQVANCLGMNVNLNTTQIRDTIIIGAGPAGLAAAVYGASEGLDVLLIETTAPGGQAGSSSKIENYLGFPTGVSGQELAARATTQAQKFGANMVIARTVMRLDCDAQPYQVILDGDEALKTRTVIIASGAQYNKLDLANLEKFEGKGIYYGATYIEAQLCGDEDVAVVGGGNSAGQAAAFLSQTGHKVYMLVRSSGLRSTMSRYLIQRLTENPAIELHYDTDIIALEGDDHLQRIVWRNRQSGETSTHNIQHLFIMTGASPQTAWLRKCVALDDKGFILTGRDLGVTGQAANGASGGSPAWHSHRPPEMLETSLPGVFAVGDVRSGNVKRVASAVGEGAISISMVHRVLAEL